MVQLFPRIASLRKRGLAGWTTLVGSVIVVTIIAMTLVAPWISPHDPSAIGVGKPPYPSPPSADFPLGTNHLGMDMLSRVSVSYTHLTLPTNREV